MPKNNLISQCFILNFAILTNFALEKIGQMWNNTLSSRNMVPKRILPCCWPGNPGNSQEVTHLVLRRI